MPPDNAKHRPAGEPSGAPKSLNGDAAHPTGHLLTIGRAPIVNVYVEVH
jgi:hypothetical protein